MTELIQTLAALTMIGALALICWCGYRQDQRLRAAREAEREAALQAAKDRAAEWLDLRRQIHALPTDFNTKEEQA